MNVEEYLMQNKKVIKQECQNIVDSGSKAIITLKDNGEAYARKISAVEEFIQTIPDNKFFKTMRDGVNNAVLHKTIPVVVFKGQAAKIIPLPDGFEDK